MSKIYLLSQGSYSDYRIVAAYSTKEKADAALALYNKDVSGSSTGEIEEYGLDEYLPTTEFWYVEVQKNGSIHEVQRNVRAPYDTETQRSSAYYYAKGHDNEGIQFSIAVDEKERAIKIALEKWTQIQAQNLWGSDEALKAVMA